MNDSNNDNNALFDLIQNIQSKLNDEQNSETDKKDNQSNNDNSNINENFDFSSIMSMLGKNKDSTHNSNNSDNNFNNAFDINTILRLQKIFSSLNGNDPKKNLLLSLKPFLRKSRQDKINEYIALMTIGDALGIFNSRGENKDE